MIKRIVILLILAVIFNVSACKKKYEEDPRKTTKTPDKRLEGTWRLESYFFNGTDIIPALNQIFNNRFKVQETTLTYIKERRDFYSVQVKFPAYSHVIKGYFDEVNIYLPETNPGPINDSIEHCWILTPLRYDTASSSLRSIWKVTKLYKEDLSMVMPTDSGDFKINWKKN